MSNSTAKARPKRSADVDVELAVQEFFVLLGRTKMAFRRLYERPPEAMEALFAARSLGPRHVAPMVRLAAEGPMSVGALAGRLGVSVPTASLLVADLSRHGLVQRREDETDRRRTIVAVAEAYRDDMARCNATRSAPVRRALERLSPSERAGFIKGLRAVAEEHERAVADAEPPVSEALGLSVASAD